MSTVTLQIGQCGNQIGEKLFSTIVSDCFEVNASLGKNSRSVGGLKKAVSLSQLHKIGRKPAHGSNDLDDEQYVSDSSNRFFSTRDRQDESETRVNSDSSSNLQARCVLVDMESKVVNRLLYCGSAGDGSSSRHRWKYRPENSYTQKKGSGNNWSFGYCERFSNVRTWSSSSLINDCQTFLGVNGPSSSRIVEETIRKEVERCDRLADFLVIMSMAGK
jgi:tubulin delta